jgi:hypothetical protein
MSQPLHPLAGTPYGTVAPGRPGAAAVVLDPQYFSATLRDVNRLHGDGKAGGRLGHDLTLREALRNVSWAWMAAHREQQVAHMRGAGRALDFPGRLNTVMAAAVHSALDGTAADPARAGFIPHTHKVPLETAHGVLREAAARMGLKRPHELLPADRRQPVATSPEVSGHTMAKTEPMRKVEALMKRSKNVRDRVRFEPQLTLPKVGVPRQELSQETVEGRRVKYAQSIGLKPEPWSGEGAFPKANRNRLPHGGNFGVEHETAHAMMTPQGKTLNQYQTHLTAHAKPRPMGDSDFDDTDDEHEAAVHDENVANMLEHKIDRRAGVAPAAFSSEFRNETSLPYAGTDREPDQYYGDAYEDDKPAIRGLPPQHVRDEAGAYAQQFDEGARFNPTGRVERMPEQGWPSGSTLDQRINLAGKAGGPGTNQGLRALMAQSRARQARRES